MRYEVASYDLSYDTGDAPQRVKAKLRGGLAEIIARLVRDHDCVAADVLAWCESAVDKAYDEKNA